MTSGIGNLPSIHCPLTPEEKELAWKAKRWMENSHDLFTQAFSDCEESVAAARERWSYRRANCEFTRNPSDFLQKTLGIIRTEAQFKCIMAQRFNLPQQGFSFNSATNRITIGVGSRVPMNGYHLQVFENIVGAISNNARTCRDLVSDTYSRYSSALQDILSAISEGGEHSWARKSDHMLNRNAISLLQSLGVDTSRTFWINDTAFEVRNGALQTRGFTQAPPPMGPEGLVRLVERAYAQNLFAAR